MPRTVTEQIPGGGCGCCTGCCTDELESTGGGPNLTADVPGCGSEVLQYVGAGSWEAVPLTCVPGSDPALLSVDLSLNCIQVASSSGGAARSYYKLTVVCNYTDSRASESAEYVATSTACDPFEVVFELGASTCLSGTVTITL